MSIQIKAPVALHQKGQQEVNEDFIYPLMDQATENERLFIISDGEGGANAGDVASKLLSLSLAKYVANTPPKDGMDKPYLTKAIRTIEETFRAYKEAHPEAREMGATLALLYFSEREVVMARIGSSRVYHFSTASRDLIGVANDNELVNRRMVTGTLDPVEVEVKQIPAAEIKTDDFFFLASDGIREQLDDRNLATMFQTKNLDSAQKVVDEIYNLIHNYTQDNFSCYVVQVAKGPETQAAAVAPTPVPTGQVKSDTTQEEPVGASQGMARGIIFGILALLVACIIGLVAIYGSGEEDPTSGTATQPVADAGLAASFLSGGDESYRMGTLESLKTAVDQYQKARELDPANFDRWQRLGQASLNVGDSLYQKHPKDCQIALPYYQVGLEIFASHPQDTKPQEAQVRIAQDRLRRCEQRHGKRPLDTTPEAIAEANQRSRQLEPATTPAKPTVSPAPKTPTTTPNARVGSTRSAPSLSEAELADMRKRRAEGRRLYSQAEARNSQTLYQQAIENLEYAAPVLDGASAYLLAYMLHIGAGGYQDEAKALKYAQKSALSGWPAGQYLYGHMLLERQYPRDTITGIQSLQQAADKNFLLAIERLAELGRFR